jgi:hypothetical protein
MTMKKANSATRHKTGLFKKIKEAVEEVKLIKQGKLKGIPAKELLDDL